MKALYISDNKESWQDFEKLFKGNFPKVKLTCVGDAIIAVEQLQNEGPFTFCLIDCNIKNDEPKAIFADVNKHNNNRPVIFLGAEGILRTRTPENMYETNSANGLIELPVEIGEFKEAISTAIAWHRKQEDEQNTIIVNKEDYLPLKIKNFYRFKSLPCDGFLELSGTKFIRIINKDEVYGEALVQKYSKKKIKYFWLEKNEYVSFLGDMIADLTARLEQKNGPLDTIALQIQATSIIHEHIRTLGVSDGVIVLTKKIISTVIKNYKRFPRMRELLLGYPLKTADSAERSILTLYLSQYLLDTMGWNSDMPRQKLGLAAVLHDSLVSNDQMLTIKTLEDYEMYDFDQLEQDEYTEHPLKAAEIARLYTGFNETDFIIAQHHELPNGKGFPQGLSSLQISGLSAIFIVSNNFVNNLVKDSISNESMNQAQQYIAENYKDGNFKVVMQNMLDLLK